MPRRGANNILALSELKQVALLSDSKQFSEDAPHVGTKQCKQKQPMENHRGPTPDRKSPLS